MDNQLHWYTIGVAELVRIWHTIKLGQYRKGQYRNKLCKNDEWTIWLRKRVQFFLEVNKFLLTKLFYIGPDTSGLCFIVLQLDFAFKKTSRETHFVIFYEKKN